MDTSFSRFIGHLRLCKIFSTSSITSIRSNKNGTEASHLLIYRSIPYKASSLIVCFPSTEVHLVLGLGTFKGQDRKAWPCILHLRHMLLWAKTEEGIWTRTGADLIEKGRRERRRLRGRGEEEEEEQRTQGSKISHSFCPPLQLIILPFYR